MFDQKLPACRNCPYYKHDFVPSEGSRRAEIVFVGDSPWRTEVERHRPLVGPAGQIYNALLEVAGLERREVYTTNAVHCKPDALGEAYPRGVVDLCTELYLKKELKRIRPRLVVPMGNSALRGLKVKDSITQARGLVKEHTLDGEVYNILPVFHPSFLLRKPAYAPYAEQDFNAIRYYLDNNQQRPDNADLDYKAVITPEQIRDFFRAFVKAKYIACDVETTGLDYRSDTLLSIQFSFRSKTGYCLPMYELPYAPHDGATITPIMHKGTRIPGVDGHPLHHLREFFYDPDKTFFFHNGKFDLRMLNQFFMKTLGSGLMVDCINWHDTMAMYGLLNENTSQSLKEIAKMHTDLRYTTKELASVKGQMKKVPLKDMVMYGTKDVDATRRLAQQFTRELHDQNLWDIYHEHDASDMKVANILYKMELFGAPINTSGMAELETFMEERLTHYHRRMERMVSKEFNPNSSDQLATILFEDLKFPWSKKTPGGKPSTDKEVISGLMLKYPRNRFLRYFRFHRDYTSIEKTFVKGFAKKLDKDGRLHPDFGFTRTVSGRVVCYKPNLANIPRDREFEEGVFVSIRNLFAVPDTHKIVYADASQIEFKTAAVLSRDKKLIKALFDDKADFHDLVARALYPKYEDTLTRYHIAKSRLAEGCTSATLRAKLEKVVQSCEIILKVGRTRSKNFNFGRIYGAQSPTLAAALGTTVEKVEPFIRRLSKRYPKFENFLTDIPRRAIQEGELISPYMRRRRFPPTLDERVESEQARQGGNFLPQSSAAYVIRGALVRIATSFERIGMASYPFNIVYDSIIVESPNDEVKDAQEIMVQEMLRPVPELFNHSFAIECGVGSSWQSAEKAARKIYTIKDFSALARI